MKDTTIDYYDNNATTYANLTVHADLSTLYTDFLQYLTHGASILDLGCGSGRDSRYFIELGYDVEAIDGSIELCKIASEYIKKPVRHLTFQSLDYNNRFDGIWACSSLLHIEKKLLPEVLLKIYNALKSNGILYASFKYGSFTGERSGRFFQDLTEYEFMNIIKQVHGLEIIKSYISNDVRPDRHDEKWINVFLRKSVGNL